MSNGLTCIILRKNRTIARLSMGTDKDFFKFQGSSYNIDKKCVGLGGKNPSPELFFIEDNPNPINSSDENSAQFLDDKFAENWLNSLLAPKSPWIDILLQYLRNPEKILSLGIILFIVVVLFASLGSFF